MQLVKPALLTVCAYKEQKNNSSGERNWVPNGGGEILMAMDSPNQKRPETSLP